MRIISSLCFFFKSWKPCSRYACGASAFYGALHISVPLSMMKWHLSFYLNWMSRSLIFPYKNFCGAISPRYSRYTYKYAALRAHRICILFFHSFMTLTFFGLHLRIHRKAFAIIIVSFRFEFIYAVNPQNIRRWENVDSKKKKKERKKFFHRCSILTNRKISINA